MTRIVLVDASQISRIIKLSGIEGLNAIALQGDKFFFSNDALTELQASITTENLNNFTNWLSTQRDADRLISIDDVTDGEYSTLDPLNKRSGNRGGDELWDMSARKLILELEGSDPDFSYQVISDDKDFFKTIDQFVENPGNSLDFQSMKKAMINLLSDPNVDISESQFETIKNSNFGSTSGLKQGDIRFPDSYEEALELKETARLLFEGPDGLPKFMAIEIAGITGALSKVARGAGPAADALEVAILVVQYNELLKTDPTAAEDLLYQTTGEITGGMLATAVFLAVVPEPTSTAAGVALLVGAMASSLAGAYAGGDFAAYLKEKLATKVGTGQAISVDDLSQIFSDFASNVDFDRAKLAEMLESGEMAHLYDVVATIAQDDYLNENHNGDMEQILAELQSLSSSQGRTFNDLFLEILEKSAASENDIELLLAIDPESCFGGDVLIDMWPRGAVFLHETDTGSRFFDQEAVLASAWQKPISKVKVGDVIVAYDDEGNLVPGSVQRVFNNEAKIILNFFGTKVTPGHVYYRPDSKTENRYETLIDILRDDGIIQSQEGVLIRAATGVNVGDQRDGFVKAVTGTRNVDGFLSATSFGNIRLGTRILVDGTRSYSVADLIEAGGGVVGDDELIRVGDSEPMPFHWEFGDKLPKPEDFVLACSGVSLEDIYKAAEWESQRPRMPAPPKIDGGLIRQEAPHEVFAMPRNEPLEVDFGTLRAVKDDDAV